MNALTSGDPGAAVASIGEYGLQRLNIIIAAYEAFLDKVRGTDDVSSTSCWSCSPRKSRCARSRRSVPPSHRPPVRPRP